MIQPSEQLWTVMYTKGVRRLINSLWKMFWIYLGYYMMTIYSAQYISFPVILIFRRMKIYKYQQIWGGGGRGCLFWWIGGALGLGLGGGGSLFYVLMFIIKCELLPIRTQCKISLTQFFWVSCNSTKISINHHATP